MKRQAGRSRLDLPSLLAYVYKPLLPYLKNVNIRRAGTRRHNPNDILLPSGYVAEVVATGLNAPVHCSFDDQGFCYVAEAGHKIDSKPRIVKVDVRTGKAETYFDLPTQHWIPTGALTGCVWLGGALYLTNTDTLWRLGSEGQLHAVVSGLPGLGDHQVNYPIVGPEGKLYFAVGSATNLGVVGADNLAYEWLAKFPTAHDVPAHDVRLAGRNYEDRDVLGTLTQTVRTGAFVPFGESTRAGQVIKGSVKSTGSILRCNRDGTGLEVVAWGLRNPYGIAFSPDGRLFATEHGIDERGRRYIIGDADDFYEIRQGAWYGWPDFASGIRLDDPSFGDGGQGREPVLAEFPDPNPPKPLVRFRPHAAANGVDFCRNAEFGFEGDAFVALYGDLAPVTTPRLSRPVGFKVVRIDMRSGEIVDFAVNKIEGPASKLPHDGFERPSHCAFGPDGHLYVVDWGEINIAPEKGGVRMKMGTGTLWRIRRVQGPRGDRPPPARSAPLYPLQFIVLPLAGLAALIAIVRAVRRRRVRR